jgi:LEA14-like dessication related protein
MSKGFLVAFGVGLAIIAICVGVVLYSQRGEHLEPRGSILKVRTQEIEDKRSLLLLYVRLVNDSDVAMTVRTITLTVETPDGNSVEGITLSAPDMRSVVKDYPLLGELSTDPLAIRNVIPPRSTIDRAIAGAFETRIADMESHKKVTVRIEGESGAAMEFSGK